jgi:hypothetical protein
MKNKKSFLFIACILSSFISMPSFAESKVCVNLPFGVGYSASFDVETLDGHFKTQNTSKFNVGETRCIDVTPLETGTDYKVTLHPFWGKTIDCSPVLTKEQGDSHITFRATGTTLSPHCSMYGI